MALQDELNWQAQKARVKADMKVLTDMGIPVETARRLAGWNITLEFDNFSDLQGPASLTPSVPTNGLRESLRLNYSRAETRVNPGGLDGAQLDAGVLYSIFIPDIPELLITQITFQLNGSPVHTEFSKPWDYAGTLPGGGSTRVTFIAGTYTIEATVVDVGGFYSFEAEFEVE